MHTWSRNTPPRGSRRVFSTLLLAVALSLGSAVAIAQAVPSLTIGAPASPAVAPAAPSLSLTLPAAAEVQIDAMGAPMDAQLLLVEGGSVLTEDSDSGDGVDARIVRFLPAGTYEVRVVEWRGRAMSARVQAVILPPMTPVASITPGAPPAIIATPAGDSPRAASAEVTLTIATAGSYRLDAIAAGNDAELMIIQNGTLIAQDSDSGEGTNAQLVQTLTPGTYTLRVRDWGNRAGSITLTVVPQ
jgi:hypothetical protein